VSIQNGMVSGAAAEWDKLCEEADEFNLRVGGVLHNARAMESLLMDELASNPDAFLQIAFCAIKDPAEAGLLARRMCVRIAEEDCK